MKCNRNEDVKNIQRAVLKNYLTNTSYKSNGIKTQNFKYKSGQEHIEQMFINQIPIIIEDDYLSV